jgi:predicted nuclease with TOPRIM domain
MADVNRMSFDATGPPRLHGFHSPHSLHSPHGVHSPAVAALSDDNRALKHENAYLREQFNQAIQLASHVDLVTNANLQLKKDLHFAQSQISDVQDRLQILTRANADLEHKLVRQEETYAKCLKRESDAYDARKAVTEAEHTRLLAEAARFREEKDNTTLAYQILRGTSAAVLEQAGRYFGVRFEAGEDLISYLGKNGSLQSVIKAKKAEIDLVHHEETQRLLSKLSETQNGFLRFLLKTSDLLSARPVAFESESSPQKLEVDVSRRVEELTASSTDLLRRLEQREGQLGRLEGEVERLKREVERLKREGVDAESKFKQKLQSQKAEWQREKTRIFAWAIDQFAQFARPGDPMEEDVFRAVIVRANEEILKFKSADRAIRKIVRTEVS